MPIPRPYPVSAYDGHLFARLDPRFDSRYYPHYEYMYALPREPRHDSRVPPQALDREYTRRDRGFDRDAHDRCRADADARPRGSDRDRDRHDDRERDHDRERDREYGRTGDRDRDRARDRDREHARVVDRDRVPSGAASSRGGGLACGERKLATSVVVSDLPKRFCLADLVKLMSSVGEVTKTATVHDNADIAVWYSTPTGATKAKRILNQAMFDGTRISVDIYRAGA
jgi:hypothetical protein